MGCISCNQLEKCTLKNTAKFTLAKQVFEAKVLHCYDGDTVTIAFPFKGEFFQKNLRIFGIDTPEIRTKNDNEKKLGLQARDYLTTLILNRIVTVHCNGEDKYGRILGTIFCDGRDIGQHMLQKGYAVEYII
jgi:micrococcal nuclease